MSSPTHLTRTTPVRNLTEAQEAPEALAGASPLEKVAVPRRSVPAKETRHAAEQPPRMPDRPEQPAVGSGLPAAGWGDDVFDVASGDDLFSADEDSQLQSGVEVADPAGGRGLQQAPSLKYDPQVLLNLLSAINVAELSNSERLQFAQEYAKSGSPSTHPISVPSLL